MATCGAYTFSRPEQPQDLTVFSRDLPHLRNHRDRERPPHDFTPSRSTAGCEIEAGNLPVRDGYDEAVALTADFSVKHRGTPPVLWTQYMPRRLTWRILCAEARLLHLRTFPLPLITLSSILLAACGYTATHTPAVPSPPTAPVSWESPARVECGPAFFAPGLMSRLREKFGNSVMCFRFAGQRQWILVGDGQTPNTRGMTDGGPMVAVDTCRTAACLDPNARHELSDFRLSYPPNPVITLKLMATHGTNVLVISNCTYFDFDTTTMRWYFESPKVTHELLAGKGSRLKPVPTSPPLNAQTVLDSDQMPPQTFRWCSR